ncbi:uncharacterized protein [Rutidosis leptorrhynchoides]|uniref:uncharacterized protein n=1 Tax=Rutidosis leptorrhynchoides TaxID=125765 RepID=UPI003A99032B
MTNEERNGDINDDIDIHDTEMVYQDDHEVNSEKELDYETEIDWERNTNREFTQPDHEQAEEDQEDQEEELVPTEQEIQNDVYSGSATTKRYVPRGPTQMKKTWEQTELERKIIVVNEFGQPVNKKSCELTHFMGVLARSGKQCPLYKRWHKTKFDIRGDADKWILQSIAKKVMSEKNKRNRQKRSLHPLIGKKSYAQIREELKEQMKELSKELPEGSLDEPGPDDIYAQVRGTAKHGQAEMYGLGVRVSDVWGEVRSREALCKENVKLKAELQEYKQHEKQKNVMTDNTVVNPHASTNNGIITNTPLQVGKEVHLKSINNPTLIVTKGRLRSFDPLTVVGGIKIGPCWGEVHVQVVIKGDEKVIRPFELFTTMIVATDVAIAWPTSLLSVVPLD